MKLSTARSVDDSACVVSLTADRSRWRSIRFVYWLQ